MLPLLFIFVPAAIIALQPDLGTAITILLFGFFIMFQSGVRIWKFILTFLLALNSHPFLWNVIKPYQQNTVLPLQIQPITFS